MTEADVAAIKDFVGDRWCYASCTLNELLGEVSRLWMETPYA